MRRAEACTVVLNGGNTFSDFIEWTVMENPCLDTLNIDLVNKIRIYRDFTQPIPDWILQYPDDNIRTNMTDDFLYCGFPFFGDNFRTG